MYTIIDTSRQTGARLGEAVRSVETMEEAVTVRCQMLMTKKAQGKRPVVWITKDAIDEGEEILFADPRIQELKSRELAKLPNISPYELKDKRSKLSLSRRELADKLGYSYRAVVSWEQGWRPVPKPVERMLSLLEHPLSTPS